VDATETIGLVVIVPGPTTLMELTPATTPMLFHKLEPDLWSTIKSFLIFLGRFPEYPKSQLHDIQVDINCLKELYKVYNEKQDS